MLGEWNCYERDFLAYFATWPEPQDGHPDDYKEHHKLLTIVIGNVVNVSPNSNFFFIPCLHAIVDLFPCPQGMELRVPISVFDKRHIGQDALETWEFIFFRAIATFFLWKFFVKMHVPGHSGVTEPPQLLVGDDDVDTMAKVWAPFFECAHISENPSFNTKDRLHFGFSDTAANKIALTLDMRGANAPRPGQRGANAPRAAQRGANAPRAAQRGANAPRPGQRGANAPRPGQRGANAPRPGQRGANAPRAAQRGANAPRPGQRGANAPRPGQRGANAPRPGQRGANSPRPAQRGANAPRPALRGANAPQAAQRGANAPRAAHVDDLCSPAY
eukprot:jgi/Tetstr1/437775/TSEL_026429.t1